MARQRQTARICTLSEIREHPWEENPGYEPSGVRTPRGLLSRVNVLATVVAKEGAGMTIDDGTAQVLVRSFEGEPKAEVGSLVLVIGRPREFNSERYLVLEICRRLRSNEWIAYRRRELAHLASHDFTEPVEQAEVGEVVQVRDGGENPFERLVAKIRELDGGQGADIEDILKAAALPEGERLLRTLLEEGEIFEIRPGKVKVLE